MHLLVFQEDLLKISIKYLEIRNSSLDIFKNSVYSPKNLSYMQKQAPDVICEKGVLRNFAKFTGKHLCQSLFFNNVPGQGLTFIKKETLAQVFSCKYWESSKSTF